MPFFVSLLKTAALGLGGLLLNRLTRRRPQTPTEAAFQAKGQIRSEVTPARWVVGTARVSGVLARHFDLIVPDAADAFIRTLDEDLSAEDLTAATQRMRLYSYWAFVLSDGETEGIQGVYVNGVRMPLAFQQNSQLFFGEIGPADPGSDEFRLLPFWAKQWDDHVVGARFAPTNFTVRPTVAIWQARGRKEDETLACATKTSHVYRLNGATSEEQADADAIRGSGLTWAMVRFTQNNGVGDERSGFDPPGPWKRNPEIDFVVKGKGPLGPDMRPLLDGNPARAAYWVLTEQMGVDPKLVADVWEQSASICDEVLSLEPVGGNPSSSGDEVAGLIEDPDFYQTLKDIAENKSLGDFDNDVPPWAVRIAALNEWKRERAVSIVERYTGRSYADVDAGTRTAIFDKWNAKFAAVEGPGARFRYRANGVLSSGSNWMEVLESLAQTMAGSIEEHGGTWHIRAGSAGIRPEVIITEEDVVEGVVHQLLEPPLELQPTEVRASLLQNERDDFSEYVLEGVTRDDATLGAVDADDALPIRDWPIATDTSGTVYGEDMADLRPRVHDIGAFDLVTDPLQAVELMRINLYKTRWNTRTVQLTVRPRENFVFYGIGKGAVVLLNLPSEGIMGEQVGERVDSMRCVVAERPRYTEEGNVELVLQQQDEEVFGAKHGLVHDYEDFGDVVLLPQPPRAEPLECFLPAVTVSPGQNISIQATATGGVGQHRFSLAGEAPFLAIDGNTGLITGTAPSITTDTFYRLLVTVRDEENQQVSCNALLTVDFRGRRPWIAVPRLRGNPQETVTGRLRVVYPTPLDERFRGAELADWSFRKVSGPSWVTVDADGDITAQIPSGQADGDSDSVAIEAQAEGVPVLAGSFRVTVGTGFSVEYEKLYVHRNTRLTLTSIVSSVQGATGAVTYARKSGESFPSGFDSPFPSAMGDVSSAAGVTANAGTYNIRIVATDSSSPAKTHEGTLTVVVEERAALPSCSIEPSTITILPSERLNANILGTGLQGTLFGSITTGPSWLELHRAVLPEVQGYAFRLAKRGQAPVGQFPVVVTIRDSAGASVSCRATVNVRRDVSPLELLADDIRGVAGGTFRGTASATGGVKPYRYLIRRPVSPTAQPASGIGLSINASTGQYFGTIYDGMSTHNYVAEVTDADGRTATDNFSVIVTRDVPPPVDTRVCVDKPLKVRAGERGTTSSFCTSDRALEFVSEAKAGNWGTFSYRAGRQGGTVTLDYAVPSTATDGTSYVFTATLQPMEIGSQQVFVRFTLTVESGTPPLALPRSDLSIVHPVNQAYARQLSASGGPANGSYVYSLPASTTRNPQPSWLTLTSGGFMEFPAQNAGRGSTAFRVTVTKGTASKTFNGTIAIQSEEDDSPGDLL